MLGTGPLSAKSYTEKTDQLERKKKNYNFKATLQPESREMIVGPTYQKCLWKLLKWLAGGDSNNYHIDFLVGQLQNHEEVS